MKILSDISALHARSALLVEQCTRLAVFATGNWYTGQKSLEEFSIAVDRFRRKEEEWRRIMRMYGVTDQQELKARLDDAVRRLQEEEDRITQFKRSRLLRWWKGASSLIFPDELNASIQKVSDAFDDILKFLQEKSKNSNLLRRAALHTPSRLPFEPDPRYVPLASTILSVVDALQDENGPDVIVLHGGPGMGKSSLARFLAIQYQNGHSSSSEGTHVQDEDYNFDHSFFPDGVFFQPCGPQAEVIDCQRSLLLMLGLLLPMFGEEKEQKDLLTELSEQLHAGLRELSALIILDDVWDEKLIENLFVPQRRCRKEINPRRRKYLITSQTHIWRNSRSIRMEDVALHDARSILATHAGFLDRHIPLNVQLTADSLIKRTGANPLALASLALAVGKKDRHDEQKWIAVEEDLVTLLDDESLPQHLMYPTNISSSIMLALTSVPSEAMELLYLASMCEGPAVPELVMRTFFCCLNGGPSKFIQWTDYLENSSLVQVRDYKISWSTVHQKTWSVHSLRQYFIRDKRRKDLQALTNRLLASVYGEKMDFEAAQTEQDLVAALCAVYGYVGEEWETDYGLVESAAKRFGIDAETLLRRKTFIKELVWCLHGKSKEKWKSSSHRLGEKIILRFLRHGDLDESDLLDLLEVDQDHAPSTACWALGALLGTDEGKFFTFERYKKVLARLLELMDQSNLPLTRETAAHALIKFTLRKDEEGQRQLPQLLSMPNCLQTLVKLVGNDTNPYAVRQCAACLFANLASVEDNKMTIGGLAEAIEALARLTIEDSSRGNEVQFVFGVPQIGHAARALANTAAADPKIALNIASQPNLVACLVSSLTNEHHSGLRESAARALKTLQTAPENTQLIAACPKVFENLLALLDVDENPETQMLALLALVGLASHEKFRYSILKNFNAKETVVRLLKKSDPKLREAATAAVGFLVLTPGCDPLKRKTSAALRGLAFLLRVNNAGLAIFANVVLNLYVFSKDERKNLLLDVPGALEGIVAMLVDTKTPKQQASAALLMANLADNDEGSLRILSTPHTVDRLVRLLQIQDRENLEPVINAGTAIGMLAQIREGSGSVAQRIVGNHPQVFESFVKLLDDHVKEDELHRDETPMETWIELNRSVPFHNINGFTESLRRMSDWPDSVASWGFCTDLRKVHQMALCALTTFICHSDEELRTRNAIQILAIRDRAVVRSAVRILNDDGSLEAAKSAAYRLLGSLACPLENKRKIAAHPRLFETLFQALIHEDGGRKTLGAWALSSLVIFDEQMGSLDSVPGALDNLAEILLGKFGDTGSPLVWQSSAVKSLINLTTSRVNKLAFVKSSTALSSLLQFINQEDLPLWIRHQALQVLANVASVGENRHILVSYGSSEWNVMETIDGLLTGVTCEMMYLAAYTVARLDWDSISQRNFDSPEALFGRANAGIEMKHFPQALADMGALASSDRKPQLPEPTALPHIWYSSCHFGRISQWANPFKIPTLWYSSCNTVFCIRILSAFNGVDRRRSKRSSGRKLKLPEPLTLPHLCTVLLPHTPKPTFDHPQSPKLENVSCPNRLPVTAYLQFRETCKGHGRRNEETNTHGGQTAPEAGLTVRTRTVTEDGTGEHLSTLMPTVKKIRSSNLGLKLCFFSLSFLCLLRLFSMLPLLALHGTTHNDVQ